MAPRSIGLVLLWVFGALCSFTGVALAVRGLARTFSASEILAVRASGGVLLLLGAAAIHSPFRRQFRPGNVPLQFARNAVHFLGQWGWTYGVMFLPLATVFALEFTAPIWLVGLAVLLLGERVTASRAIAIALGLVGVLVILRPGYIGLQPAALVVLAAAIAFAATAVCTKALTRTVPTFAILFWMNALQVWPNLALAGSEFWTRLDGSHAPLVALLVCGGVASHLCLTQAYRYGDAILVMPLDFLRIPLSAALGFLLYSEPVDLPVFIGAAIIIGGLVYNLRAEARAGLTASRTPGSAPAS